MIEESNSNNNADKNFFEKMENASPRFPLKKLERSRTNVMLTGVCAGIAKYLNADAANVRLVAVLSLLLGGWSAVAYLIIAALLPAETNHAVLTSEESQSQRKENFKVLLSGILMFVGFYFALQKIGFGGWQLFVLPNSYMMPVLSIAVGIYLFFSREENWQEIDFEYLTEFTRSRERRMLMGVCGGLGKYFSVDTSSIRIIFIIATMLTLGLFALAYLIVGLLTQFENSGSYEI